jgi:hypothetical protein
MTRQLTDAKRPGFFPLFSVYDHQSLRDVVIGSAALALAAAVARFSRRPRARSSTLWAIADITTRLVASGVVLHVAFAQHLLTAVGRQLFTTWGTSLAWLLVVQLLVDGRREGRVNGLLVFAAGWMTALSWGYPVPNLVGGSIAFVILYRVWQDPPQVELLTRRWLAPVIATTATLVVTAAVTVSFLHARATYVYRDWRASDLTADLGTLSSEFRGIRTNAWTFSYIENVMRCVQRFPASRVAILPANAGLYGILDLHNPFSVDWAWTDEMVGNAAARMLADARSLSLEGDYLVLFDTAPPELLAYSGPLRSVSDFNAPVYFYYDNALLGEEIRNALTGVRITCGDLVGVYGLPRTTP